jgi:hypothetical protein
MMKIQDVETKLEISQTLFEDKKKELLLVKMYSKMQNLIIGS